MCLSVWVEVNGFVITLPEEEPRAWWASVGRGRAKGTVRVDGRWEKLRFVEMLEVRTPLLPLPPGEVPPEGRGRGIVQTFGSGMQFRMRNPCSGSMDSLWVELVR